MTSRSLTDEAKLHDGLVAAVVDLLEEKAWTVETTPRLDGSLRPDIVARNPKGNPFVFEVKTDSSQADLGAVAQVETYRNSLAAQDNNEATGVLVVTADAPKELGEIARDAGVELIQPDANDASSVKEFVSSHFTELA